MKTFLPTLILAIGCGINAVQAGRLRSYDAEEETSLLRGRMLQTSMSLSTIDAQPLKGAEWTDDSVPTDVTKKSNKMKSKKMKSKKMKSKKMKSKKIKSVKEAKKLSWKKEAPKKWSWKKEASKKMKSKKMKSKKLSKKKKSNKMEKSAPKKKSKMKSQNKSPMKSSKIDKLIELKTELGQLFLVASGIATPEEVEDMSLGELLGMMAFALKGSLPKDKGRLLKDVAEGVGMDMDTVTDLLKEMLQDMI